MSSLPPEFVNMLSGLGLADAAEALAAGTPEVSVRINGSKPVDPPSALPVPWCPSGFYLPERPVFTLDPSWHQGRYYVQEAGSMFISHAVGTIARQWTGPVAVLDACAAPGGKTTAVIDLLPEGSLMVANEYVPSRAAILKENIVKWGYPSTIVTRGDTSRLVPLGETFDLVIADVPCSGEGMMRKDATAVSQWSPRLIEECAALQREIIRNLWATLRPGGHLIYSTCTFNLDENERNVARIIDTLGAESVEIPVEESWHITPAIDAPAGLHAYRFIPGRTRGEGLFLSVLRKPAEGEGESLSRDNVIPSSRDVITLSRYNVITKKSLPPSKKSSRAPVSKIPAEVTSWFTGPARYDLTVSADRINAMPREWTPLLQKLITLTDVIHDGLHIATLKGRDYIPAHSLIMSDAFRREAFPNVEIDRDTALDYLRGLSPALPSDVPRGIAVLTWQGRPLGLVKNIGNRTNSLYPREWQIKNL